MSVKQIFQNKNALKTWQSEGTAVAQFLFEFGTLFDLWQPGTYENKVELCQSQNEVFECTFIDSTRCFRIGNEVLGLK